MTSMTERLRPHSPVLPRFLAIFRKDDSVIDPGAAYDRATLRAIRDLPPHILKDIGAENL